MFYKSQPLILVAILLTGAHISPISYDKNVRLTSSDLVRRARKIEPIKLNLEYLKNVDFSKMFKQLHAYLSPEEVRIVTTLGLVTGILRAEQSMREHLYVLTDDLIDSFNSKKPKENMEKLVAIEQMINRDKSIVKVLNGMLKYARNATTLDVLQAELLGVLRENDSATKRLQNKMSAEDERFGADLRIHMKEQLYELRVMIDEHIEQMHTSITENAKQTLKFIQTMVRSNKNIRKRPIGTEIAKLDPSMFAVRRLWDQVAAEDKSLNAKDFDVAFNYQPRNSRSKSTKEQKSVKPVEQKNVQKAEKRKENLEERKGKTEERRNKPKAEQKKKPRITKGEEMEEAEKIMALILNGDEKQLLARISRGDEQSNNESSTSTPSSMVELIMVNAKIDRFKRKGLTVNGKMDMDPFDLSVDIDVIHNSDDDEDGKDNDDDDEYDEKPKEKTASKMKKRRVTENEIEGFGFDDHRSEKQEDTTTYIPLEGGLGGLIANLSGGPDGSDIGTVVAALSGVLNNIFGPGGIDLQGIVGTATALLASLIGGDENFGRVLANILGLSIEGFSGGGGADKNGQFFGQFVGRFISILSADPEDPDESPLRPALFIENFYDGIGKGSQTNEPREDDPSMDGGLNKEPNFGSDSSSFIKSVIGGLFSVFTSASTSASAGASQHSAGASIDGAGHSSDSSSQKIKDHFGLKSKDDDNNNNNNNNKRSISKITS